MNPFEMVAFIVVVVMVASIFRSRSGRQRRRDQGDIAPREEVENLRLREEVKMLKERVQTLERITVEKENSLSREIEQLRDR